MKIVKKLLKIIIFIFPLLLIAILIDYVKLNIHYYINKNIYDETFDVKGNKNKYTPQGLAYSKEYNIILQTSYNSKHDVSMLYVTDFNTGKLLKKLKLKEIDDKDNINHVGGITTNKDKIWITNDHEVNEYNLKEILNSKNDYIKSENNKKIPNRGDFCLYNNNILWIGDFFLNPLYKVPDDNPLLLGYKNNKTINYKSPDYVISLPKMIQGMAITDDNKFIFTASFTNLINSKLMLYDNPLKEKNDYYEINNKKIPYYNFNNNNLINSIKIPPMAEGLFYKDNNIYILFENSSDTYFYAYPKINKIIKLNINKLDK